MMIRRLVTLTVLLAAALTAPIASAQRIDERIDHAAERIERGVRSGSLNRGEAETLRIELQNIRRDERVFRSDGRLGPNERERLHRELDRLERRIDRFKSN